MNEVKFDHVNEEVQALYKARVLQYNRIIADNDMQSIKHDTISPRMLHFLSKIYKEKEKEIN